MRSWVVLVALVFGSSAVLFGGWFVLTHRGPNATPVGDLAASGARVTVLYPAPAFSFEDQLGRPLSSQTLRGRPYIASFLFTSCRTLCPLLAAKLVVLQRRLRQPDLRFVSFSVDPEHDTQAALLDYQQRWHAKETRWLLARTQPESLAPLADGFGVAVEKGETAEDPVIHSGAFLLVSAEGQVVGAYNSNDEEALERLGEAVDALLGTAAEPTLVTDGSELVHSLGCLGCHAEAALAPQFQGAPRQVRLETGAVVEVDRTYLRESLVSPAKKRVAGYPLGMPAYGQRLNDLQLDNIVTFLFSQPVSTAEAPAVLEVDPVCQMNVRVTETTPSAPFDGGVAHFCSTMCRDRFLAR